MSSRISGRIMELKVTRRCSGSRAEVAGLESRQPGDPPPTITLKAPSAAASSPRPMCASAQPLEPEKTLLEITDLSEVCAIARVPEHQAGRMKPGTIAHIKVASLPDEKFDGELLRFGTEADRESGTIDAIFKLPNPNLTHPPGHEGGVFHRAEQTGRCDERAPLRAAGGGRITRLCM